MKRYVLAAIVPAAVFLLPSALSAQDAAASDGQITAMGRQDGHYSWLSTEGPDRNGDYVMRIGIADLDPATEAGWVQMRSRVHLGTGQLCNKAGALPLVGGRYSGAQRECWVETRSQAMMQMQRLRTSAAEGRRVTELGIRMIPLQR